MAASASRLALKLGSFPINVRLEPRRRATRSPSFKRLGPDARPPVSKTYAETTGEEIAETLKGVQVGRDEYRILTPDALALIDSVTKDVTVEPDAIVPLESVDLSLSMRSFSVCADKDVPGSEEPFSVLWNGLSGMESAYVAQVAGLAGAMDAILVVFADGPHLRAELLPFVDELYPTTDYEVEPDDEAQELFETFVEKIYADRVGEFDHGAYESEFKKRREEAIQATLDGEPIKVPEAPKPAAGPSLKEMLEASIKDAAPKKKAARKKPAAKKTTRKKVSA